ncbi:hypothetical protein COCNU_scaffold023768G000010 [Cocos nucifera]|nr:hypothetical protein [Cocos nucifera]
MDVVAVEMLTKGLRARKRKGKALSESSKKAKVDAPSFATPTAIAVASKVIEGTKVIPTVEVGAVDGGYMPPTSSRPPAEDQALQPPIEKEKGGEKKKKKKVIVKTSRKAHSSESNDDSNDLGEDPFSNPEIIWDLTDKFGISKVVDRMADLDHVQLIWDFLRTFLKLGHQILAHIRMVHRLMAEALKVLEDLQAEVAHL